MGKKGGTYYSAEQLAKIVAQARAAGRRELVDELRGMYGVPETGQRLRDLYHWLEGRLSMDNERTVALGHGSLSNVLGMLTAIDQEVIDEPGF